MGWKCRQQGEAGGYLAADNVDTAVAYPNMGRQTAYVVRHRAVIKYGGYATAPQHELCGKTLLKANGAPRHSGCGHDDCPANAPHLSMARVLRWLWSTDRTCCQVPDMAERKHSYGEPGDRQP